MNIDVTIVLTCLVICSTRNNEMSNLRSHLSKHKFCISPRGRGVDCHRHWECLYLGVIPIIEKSPEMKDFADLPILYVDNYHKINVKYLNQIYEEFQKKTFNMEKLNLMYWNNKIKGHFKDSFYTN